MKQPVAIKNNDFILFFLVGLLHLIVIIINNTVKIYEAFDDKGILIVQNRAIIVLIAKEKPNQDNI